MQSYLMMVLFFVGIIGLISLYRWPRFRPVLDIGISLMRYRYCLLLCFAPAILGAAAWYDPYMLSAILVVRSGVFEIMVITMICFFAVGVGLAEMQLIRLHGTARFADRKLLLAGPVDPTHEVSALAYSFTLGQPRKSWSKRRIASWIVLSLILPAFCVASAVTDNAAVANADKQRKEALANSVHAVAKTTYDQALARAVAEKESVPQLCCGILAGVVLAMLVSILVAVLQRIVLGGIDEAAESGILPFEFVVPKKLLPTTRMHRWAAYLFGTRNKGFSKWMDGPGYTDRSTGLLLAGQAQNIILIVFSACVYLANYVYGVWVDTGWTRLDWPNAFYAVLLLFLIGFFMTGLAYWLDRFGLPPSVFAGLYVLGCFSVGASDHYFEVDVKPRRLTDYSNVVGVDDSNSYVAAAHGQVLQECSLEQLYWADTLEEWPFPEIDGKKTLVVVTASGGGIQAAAWTTKVLTELDKELPGFGRSIGLISSVSGGSVGAMHYVGHRGPFSKPLTPAIQESIEGTARTASLEAVSWGLVFPDFVRSIAPPAAPPLTDRGWALESWWWNQMGRPNRPDRIAMQEVTIRDLVPQIKDHKIPPIMFNSTCVETGQRVLISPIHVDVALEERSGLDPRDHQPVSRPIDFLEYYDECVASHKRNNSAAWTRVNVRVSTAARLSATFSYVTPVARPCPAQDFGLLPLIQRRFSNPTDLEKRLHLHFCDGGVPQPENGTRPKPPAPVRAPAAIREARLCKGPPNSGFHRWSSLGFRVHSP